MVRPLRFLFLCFLSAYAGPLLAQESGETVALRAGDVLRITVWRNPEFTGEFTVLHDGALSHPLLREVRVAGSRITAVEQSIRSLLSKFESNPQIVIEPLYRIVVGGEVRTPGIHLVSPAATVAEAVATAGGLTDQAKSDEVRLYRGGKLITVDLTSPDPAGMAHQPIRSGDQLFVERRVSIFRDYIAPAGSILAALAAVANILLR